MRPFARRVWGDAPGPGLLVAGLVQHNHRLLQNLLERRTILHGV